MLRMKETLEELNPVSEDGRDCLTSVEAAATAPTASQALFVELVLPVLDDLYRVACRLEGDRERAQDLLQEALLLGYRKLDQLEEPRSFRVWAVRILRRVFLNSRRRTREEPLGEAEAPERSSVFVTPPLDPQERFEARRRAADLKEALDELPP
jgi:RNA polymerase sigma factor (sigma-70 family)